MGFEPANSAEERQQTYALGRAATGTGDNKYTNYIKHTHTQYSDTNLEGSPHHVQQTPSNVPLRQKFIVRRKLLATVPASHAPLHLIRSDVHVRAYFRGPKLMKIVGT